MYVCCWCTVWIRYCFTHLSWPHLPFFKCFLTSFLPFHPLVSSPPLMNCTPYGRSPSVFLSFTNKKGKCMWTFLLFTWIMHDTARYFSPCSWRLWHSALLRVLEREVWAAVASWRWDTNVHCACALRAHSCLSISLPIWMPPPHTHSISTSYFVYCAMQDHLSAEQPNCDLLYLYWHQHLLALCYITADVVKLALHFHDHDSGVTYTCILEWSRDRGKVNNFWKQDIKSYFF